jgi:hypothetical protein
MIMKNINVSIKLSLMFAFGIVLCACQEKIDLDLKNAEPQLVIEGIVTNQPGAFGVGLTKSKLYDEDNTPLFVIDATVWISDDAGNTDTLSQVQPGIYVSQPKTGIPGTTYTLKVWHENVLYQSVSRMPYPVNVDSIYYQEVAGFTDPNDLSRRSYVIINDPVSVPNYYVMKTWVNSKLRGSVRVYSDRLWDGKPRNLRAPGSDLEVGDTVTVEVRSIDKSVFDYFYELQQNNGNMGQPAAPANPTSNINPKTLGYFSAYSITTITDIVK